MASLGKDLSAIRKEQDLSFEDIYEETKIPKHIIQSIEDDSIFTDFDENATYIRSYVRTYAKALSIDEQQIIYALDQQKIDKYRGSLRSEEGREIADEDTDESPIDEGLPEEPSEDAVPPSEPDPERDAERYSTKKEEAPSVSATRTPQRSKNVDWGNMGRNVQPVQSKSNLWMGALIILVLLAGGLYYFLSLPDENDPASPDAVAENEAASPSVTESDSLQLNIVPPVEEDTVEEETTPLAGQEPPAGASLSDTLDLVVYAAYGNLSPVRVYTDVMGNINPYWIEEGEAIRFDFVNEFRVRGQFDNIELLMNGHVIENARDRFYNPETRLVELDRAFFEGDERWLQPPPETLPIEAQPPSIIRERPTYN